MRYLEDIVSMHFRAEEDATRELVVIVLDSKGGEHRSLPQKVVGDPGLTDFHRGHAGSRVNYEDCP